MVDLLHDIYFILEALNGELIIFGFLHCCLFEYFDSVLLFVLDFSAEDDFGKAPLSNDFFKSVLFLELRKNALPFQIIHPIWKFKRWLTKKHRKPIAFLQVNKLNLFVVLILKISKF